MVTDNFIEFGHRWFGLANIKEFIEDMDEYYSDRGLGKYSEIEANTRAVFIPTSSVKQSPIEFTNDRVVKVCSFYNKRNPEINYNTLMECK